jgi:hypothetical protein
VQSTAASNPQRLTDRASRSHQVGGIMATRIAAIDEHHGMKRCPPGCSNYPLALRLQPQLYCFSSGGIAAVDGSGTDCVSVEGIAPLSSGPTQSPAHSLVPLTLPTSLQPIGFFGLTCSSGLLPAFGGASWAYALVEKQTAVKITSAFIVISPSPFIPRRDSERTSNRFKPVASTPNDPAGRARVGTLAAGLRGKRPTANALTGA